MPAQIEKPAAAAPADNTQVATSIEEDSRALRLACGEHAHARPDSRVAVYSACRQRWQVLDAAEAKERLEDALEDGEAWWDLESVVDVWVNDPDEET